VRSAEAPHVAAESAAFGLSPGLERERIPFVVLQHVEVTAQLRRLRSILVRAPHVRLLQLGRLDERIAAHLDGVVVAGSYGAGLSTQALASPDAGNVFLASALAIESGDLHALERLLALTEALPESRPGLLSAFGWMPGARLLGLARALLDAKPAWWRTVGVAACAMHRVDPGAALTHATTDASTELRRRALRTVGVCGRADLLETCLRALRDPDGQCVFEAARSALLLGDRAESLSTLEALAAEGASATSIAAQQLVLKIVPNDRARALLAMVAHQPGQERKLIKGIAILGDPHYVPWLLEQMSAPMMARIAAEAFSFLTGLDLSYLDLDRRAPEGAPTVPNEDPRALEVGLDEDESLPWPDVGKLAAWWQANGGRFAPGTRCFMGGALTLSSCLEVLKTGFQRQRIAAAEYLALLTPRKPLFAVAAPAWRQQRLLSSMDG